MSKKEIILDGKWIRRNKITKKNLCGICRIPIDISKSLTILDEVSINTYIKLYVCDHCHLNCAIDEENMKNE